MALEYVIAFGASALMLVSWAVLPIRNNKK